MKIVNLDFIKGIDTELNFMQYDFNADKVKMNLTNDNNKIDLTGKEVFLKGVKNNGEGIFITCNITNASEGEIEFDISEQMTTQSGLTKWQVVINGVEYSKLSKQFIIIIGNSLKIDEQIIETTDFKTLKEKLDKVVEWDNYFENVTPNLENKYTEKLNYINSQLDDNTSEINILKPQVNSLASGSPKGVYATVSALTTAFPTGNSNVYVVSADGGWYYWSGSAWVKGGTYQSTSIADYSITPIKLDRTYCDGIAKGNMFDFTQLIDNKYYHTDGTVLTGNNTTFILPPIKLTIGSTYMISSIGVRSFLICDLNGVITYSGTNANISTKFPLVADNNNCILKVSFYNATGKDASMLVKGTTLPSTYQPYIVVPKDLGINSIKPEHLSSEVLALITGVNSSIITVDKKGSGQYTSIQTAIDSVSDSVSTPTTILIYTGIYNETVKIKNRYISLIGIDKKNTIIITTTGDYAEPPLEIGGGQLYFKNLTFKATHDTPKADYGSVVNRAYAVHADFVGEGTTIFENCDLISYQSACLGSGTHPKQKLVFKDCNFERYSDGGFTPVAGNYGAIFVHSAPYATTEKQEYEFYNCRIYTEQLHCVRMSKQTSDYSVLWVNNYCCGTKSISISGTGLNADSFGNNVATLNV